MELEPIRELLAARYGIVVRADDPILAAVALNDIVLDRHAARVDDLLQQHARQLAEVDAQRLAKHRDLAKLILGEALRQAKTELAATARHQGTASGTRRTTAPPGARVWQITSLILGIAAFVGWTALLAITLH